MPEIGLPADDGQHQLLALGSDPDGRVRFLYRSWTVSSFFQLVVAALEAGTVFRHERPHHLHTLLQAFCSLANPWKRDAEFLVLALVPGRAQPQLEPAIGNMVDCHGFGGEDRGDDG